MISIHGEREDTEPEIVPLAVIKIGLKFDEEKYNSIKGTTNYAYYLELLENGFKQANKFKVIPLDILLGILTEFKLNNCKNEWLHKKKKFKELDLEIVLTCQFTTNYFKLTLTINQISNKKELLKGAVITTEPDEVLFEKMYKDILIYENKIIITDASDAPRILIDKGEALLGKLRFDIIGPEQIRKMLSYSPLIRN